MGNYPIGTTLTDTIVWDKANHWEGRALNWENKMGLTLTGL